MGITENAAYFKGLFDGYELDKTSKEGKIIAGMLDLISDMADKISALEADNNELHKYCEELDSDLGQLEEEFFYGGEDEEYDDHNDLNDDDDYDDLNDDEDYECNDDSEYYEIECPSCGEVICFDDSLKLETLVCPACGEKLEDIEICDGNCDSCNDEECEGKQ